MKAFIAGGTGFIGSHVAESLADGWFDLVCAVRKTSDTSLLEELGAEIHVGDITDAEFLKKAMKGSDVVVNCAGLLGGWKTTDQELWDVNVQAAAAIAKAANGCGAKKMVHLSSAGVYGFTGRAPVSEGAALTPNSAYGVSKLEGEKAVEENKGNTPLIILRPSTVYGPRDRHLLKLYHTIKHGLYFNIDGGRSLIHPTYIEDVVDAVSQAIKTDTQHSIFNVAGQCCTHKEFAAAIADALGVPPPNMNVPKNLAKIAANTCSLLLGFLWEQPLTPAKVESLTRDRAFSTKKIEAETGWKPKVSLQEGMTKTIDWAKEERLL